jgi:steroid delta-isomerase-like uncharacterized protein
MNKVHIFFAVLAFTGGSGFILSASAQVTAVRSMPYEEYWQIQKQEITIEVTGEPGPITVFETPPAGWTISEIYPSSGMSLNEGVITWDLLSFDGSQTFRYKVTTPEDTEGEVVFSGKIGVQPIDGMTIQTLATQKPLGIFDDHKDIIEILKETNAATYDPETGEYVIYGAGVKGHFAYIELNGDFTLKARMHGENPHASEPAALIVADTVTQNISGYGSSAFYSVLLRGEGGAKALWNLGIGGSGDLTSFTSGKLSDGRYVMTRQGNTLSMYYFNTSIQSWKQHNTVDIVFTDPVYVGILAVSAAPQSHSTGYFSEVELTVSEDLLQEIIEEKITDVLNAHDLDGLSSFFTDDIIYDFTPMPEPMKGKEQVLGFFQTLFQAFPDWHITRDRILVTGNTLVAESTITGTQLGEWLGYSPLGNGVQINSILKVEFAGTKIKRITEYLDMAGIMIQLGHMKSPDLPPFELPFEPYDPPVTLLPPVEAAEEFISRWNTQSLILLSDSINPEADIYMYPLGIPTDKDAYIASFQMYFTAFPDLRGDIVNLLDLGDGWVFGELVYKGTQNGEFLGFPPSEIYSELKGAILWRFDDEGMAINIYVYFDNITLLTQLGLIPTSDTSVENWEIYQ